MKMKNWFFLIVFHLAIYSPGLFAGLSDDNMTIHWAGCGITKKAFMAE